MFSTISRTGARFQPNPFAIMKKRPQPAPPSRKSTASASAKPAPNGAAQRVPRKLRPPFPRLPREVERLWEAQDCIAIEEEHIQWLRGRPELSSEQRRELEKYEALQARLRGEPHTVLSEAVEALQQGLELLTRVVHSRRLRIPVRFTDGTPDRENDEACEQLAYWAAALNHWLMHFAGQRFPHTRTALFFQSKALTEAFMPMARAHPEDFISAAESSITMPSLRARNPKYTADAARIAKAIRLGEKHPAPDISDNRSRTGAEAHLLMARLVDSIHSAQVEYRRRAEELTALQNFSESAEEYCGVELEDYLRSNYYPAKFDHLMACAALPPWEENPEAWWHGRLLYLIRQEHEELEHNPDRNPGLWQELIKGGESLNSTPNDRRRSLEKSCYNKFLQFVRAARRKPARGQHA